jgi:hypothetical protein
MPSCCLGAPGRGGSPPSLGECSWRSSYPTPRSCSGSWSLLCWGTRLERLSTTSCWARSRPQRAEGVLDQIRYLWEQTLELRLPIGRSLRASLFRIYSRLLSGATTPESAQDDVDEVREDLADAQRELHAARRNGVISEGEAHAVREEAMEQADRLDSLAANAGWSSRKVVEVKREPLAITTGRDKEYASSDIIKLLNAEELLTEAMPTPRSRPARSSRPLGPGERDQPATGE